MKQVLGLFTAVFVLTGILHGQVTYNVSGTVQLEDQMVPDGDHSGVKMVFFNLPSMEERIRQKRILGVIIALMSLRDTTWWSGQKMVMYHGS